jgi:hypothetical protein
LGVAAGAADSGLFFFALDLDFAVERGASMAGSFVFVFLFVVGGDVGIGTSGGYGVV